MEMIFLVTLQFIMFFSLFWSHFNKKTDNLVIAGVMVILVAIWIAERKILNALEGFTG